MSLAYALDDFRHARGASAFEVMDRQGVRVAFARDEEIYGQGDPVEFLYRLRSGIVRTTRITADGRRQVGDFYHAGDLFGLEPGPDHQYAAEALTDCSVQQVRRSAVRAFGGGPELDHAILEATRRELQRTQEHVMLLGRKGAREKVAAFLLSLSAGKPHSEVDLSMSRQDIADYLGLTIETVSRMLTRLQCDAIVEFPAARRFRIKNWGALEALVD
jgi:CRP/FNR family nitrogen fixation transcriptional regulator